jgi:predicted MFS family arabinose efflux permease
VTGGLVALVFAIVRTQSYPWTSPQTFVPLGIGLALLGAFLLVQTRHAREPLMPLRIFRSRQLSAGNVYLMLLFAAMFGTWYFETLFMQRVLGYTPLQAGLAFLPQTVVIAAGSQIASRLVTRVGSRPMLLVGTALAATGVGWLSQITAGSTFLGDLLGPFLLVGLGMGLSVTPATVAATAGVPSEDAGLASGLLNTSRFIGASIGLAVLATVAADRTTAVLGTLASTRGQVAAALTDGYARALDVGAVILIAAGLVAALAIPPLRRPSRRSVTSTPAPETIPLLEEDTELEPA